MELKHLEELDIIEPVTGPTPWVSPIVAVPKSSGQVRICVDMREANKAVKREKHLMPTIDDLVADLNGATVFSWIPPTRASTREPSHHHIQHTRRTSTIQTLNVWNQRGVRDFPERN